MTWTDGHQLRTTAEYQRDVVVTYDTRMADIDDMPGMDRPARTAARGNGRDRGHTRGHARGHAQPQHSHSTLSPVKSSAQPAAPAAAFPRPRPAEAADTPQSIAHAGDVFTKARHFTRLREVQAMGLHPYFVPVHASGSTEVIIDGERGVMVGSNNYLGLSHDPRRRRRSRRDHEVRYGLYRQPVPERQHRVA